VLWDWLDGSRTGWDLVSCLGVFAFASWTECLNDDDLWKSLANLQSADPVLTSEIVKHPLADIRHQGQSNERLRKVTL